MSEIYLGLGLNDERQVLRLDKANRHGLIAGATGTGKTVTLQTMAEQFSAAGVPVFVADVKGDLSGISMAGSRPLRMRTSWKNVPNKLASPIILTTIITLFSRTCTVRRATRSAPQFPKWGRCCFPV